MAKAATTARKATKATEAEANAADENKAAADAAAQAENEAKAAQLDDLRNRLVDQLEDLKSADKESAIDARLRWVGIGRTLIEGRSMFLSGNNVNDQAFGQWIVKQGLDALGQRPSRAAAIWIAETHDQNEALYNLFPTESRNGEPLRRSPRTLKDWVRDQVHATFQLAWEAASDEIEIASDVADKDERAATAKATMPNVYSALLEVIDSAEAKVEDAQGKLKAAKGSAERAKATDDFNRASDIMDYYTGLKDVLDAVGESERLTYFATWKPKQQSVSFKDSDVADAAARVFALLRTHEQFAEVYEALGALVEAESAKVKDEAAAKAEAEAKARKEAETGDTGEDFTGGDDEGADADAEGDNAAEAEDGEIPDWDTSEGEFAGDEE